MKKLRSWVTQVTIGSFLLVGVTGLFLFFGVTGSLIVVAHEWVSLLFIVAAALHTWLNWSAVCASLSRARGILIVGFFAVLLIFSIAPGDTVEEFLQARGRVDKDVLCKKAGNLLLEAPLSTVAELTGRTPQQLRDRLARKGVRITSDEVSLVDVAAQTQAHPLHLLDVILQDAAAYQHR